MKEYLVAVEQPCGENVETIVVTDDIEGFGPDVLAVYPILTIEAGTPVLAGYRYARRHGIIHTLIIINLPDTSEEWWIEATQAHRVDDRVDTIWEPL